MIEFEFVSLVSYKIIWIFEEIMDRESISYVIFVSEIFLKIYEMKN